MRVSSGILLPLLSRWGHPFPGFGQQRSRSQRILKCTEVQTLPTFSLSSSSFSRPIPFPLLLSRHPLGGEPNNNVWRRSKGSGRRRRWWRWWWQWRSSKEASPHVYLRSLPIQQPIREFPAMTRPLVDCLPPPSLTFFLPPSANKTSRAPSFLLTARARAERASRAGVLREKSKDGAQGSFSRRQLHSKRSFFP